LNTDKTLIVGHRNPDMDAVAAAVGYAWFLNHGRDGMYEAGRLGALNAQTVFALHRFKLDAPVLIADVRPHISDVTEKIEPLSLEMSLKTVCQIIAQHLQSMPMVDAEGKPAGLVSGAGLFQHVVAALDDPQRLDQPVSSALESVPFTLNDSDNISDILNRVLRSEQDNFIVVDSDGRYTGLCRKLALLNPPRRRVILVDHNELAQSVPGLEEAELIEILDHHRLNALPTTTPIRLQIDPVGSCSTLVAERILEYAIELPPSIAGILLCGILSDTLGFRSPTTTMRDRSVTKTLARRAGVKVDELSAELLNAGAGLASRTPHDIVNGDLKLYPEDSAGIAQVEITNFNELVQHLDALHEALTDLLQRQNLKLAVLMVTNVVSGDSRLVVAGESRLLSALPYSRLPDGTFDAPGVVSRKKQLLPAVLSAVKA
jgi:manganese-dependent inorganic pyrophosphatase